MDDSTGEWRRRRDCRLEQGYRQGWRREPELGKGNTVAERDNKAEQHREWEQLLEQEVGEQLREQGKAEGNSKVEQCKLQGGPELEQVVEQGLERELVVVEEEEQVQQQLEHNKGELHKDCSME